MSQINQPIVQTAKLTDVTVFLQGAELFHHTTCELTAGENEIVIERVAQRIHEQSLSVSLKNGVVLLSVSVRADHMEDGALAPKAQELQDRLEQKEEEKDRVQIEGAVLAEQIQVLQANRKMVQEGVLVSTAELGQMVDFIAQRVHSIWVRQAQLNREIEKLDEEIEKLKEQLNVERSSDKERAGKIILKVLANEATQTRISLSYMTYDAGWKPTYDLRADHVKSPITLVYKGNIHQSTGLHWEGVQLKLSSGNPTMGVQRPTLYPWFIRKESTHYAAETMVRSMVADEVAAPVMMKLKTVAREVNTLANYVQVNTQGVNTSFDIAIAYTIPCDGQTHQVMIMSEEIDANYCYVCVPKLSTDVFLQARITDWKDLNLLPGKTSVYFAGSYVGHGEISLERLEEGLDLSLGKEKRILVERIEDKNNRAKAGLLGKGEQRLFAYTVKMNNTCNDEVRLLIKDQLPVSQDSEITVTDLELCGGMLNEKTGELTWSHTLQAKEEGHFVFSYAVRYPKDITVEGI